MNFIVWNANPELFSMGFLQLRWYGLLFAFGFIISQQILYYMHKKEGKPLQDVDTLTVFMVIATIIGARLGHVLFYEPEKYLANPVEILMINKGGLASHGAAVGILIAIWVYSRYSITFKGIKMKVEKIRRKNQSYMQVLDRLVVLIAMTAVLIRIGNFANSEIEGKPTGTPNGVFFARTVTDRLISPQTPIKQIEYAKVDSIVLQSDIQPIKLLVEFKRGYEEGQIRYYIENTLSSILSSDKYIAKYISHNGDMPIKYNVVEDQGTWNAIIETGAIIRYPTQLVEAAGYLVVFLILLFIWFKYKEKTPEGRLFGLFLILLFGLRFIFEFIKENQVDFESTLPINMGQILSIPLIITGIIIVIRSYGSAAKISD